MELIFFLIFGVTAVMTAGAVIVFRNPINSAMSLVVTFLNLAAVYVLLNAHFIAVVQILVYAGAIMVLFLFVLMLLNQRDEDLGERRFDLFKIMGGVMGASLFIVFALWFWAGELPILQQMSAEEIARIPAEWGGIASVGERLFSDYVLPFEIASILLLVGVVGGLMIAKKRI